MAPSIPAGGAGPGGEPRGTGPAPDGRRTTAPAMSRRRRPPPPEMPLEMPPEMPPADADAGDVDVEMVGADLVASRPPPRFLYPREVGRDQPVAVLVAYPRSGTTLLRCLLERSLGVFTGSDTSPRKRLGEELRRMGLAGEGVVDGSVLLVKSHFPERRGVAEFAASRVVLLVRSPFSAVDSLFNLYLTRSHMHSVRDAVYDRLAADWDELVRTEASVWGAFHRHWRAEARRGVPLLVVRYEDLVREPRPTLRSVLGFLRPHLPGAASSPQMDLDLGQCLAALGAYPPRRAATPGAALRHFSRPQAAAVAAAAGGELERFGYSPCGACAPLPADLGALAEPVGERQRVAWLNRGATVRDLVPGAQRFADAGFRALRGSLDEPAVAGEARAAKRVRVADGR